jgi:hypothetical protein
MKATECYIYNHNGTKKDIYRTPNQRILHIHLVCENNHNSINYTAHINARNNLSKNAFQLYDYLEFNPNDTVWALSSSHLYKQTCLTEQTYAKAFNELLEKGYLVKKPITVTTAPIIENAYHFYEDVSLASKPLNNDKPSKTTPAVSSTRHCLADEVF